MSHDPEDYTRAILKLEAKADEYQSFKRRCRNTGMVIDDFYEVQQYRKWTNSGKHDNVGRAKIILDSVFEYQRDWPLTLRQIFYLVIGRGFPSDKYTELGCLINQMKLDDIIPWDALEDRSSYVSIPTRYADKEEYREWVVGWFDGNYERDLMQGQKKHIEVWSEKDTMRTIFKKATAPYGIPLVTAGGFTSLQLVYEFANRVSDAKSQGKRTVMLYCGDFDPSGCAMFDSIQKQYDKLETGNHVRFIRAALTQEQIARYGLTKHEVPIKMSDTRAKGFLEEYGVGTPCVELDAFKPSDLVPFIQGVIESYMNMSKFERQCEIQEEDEGALLSLKGQIDDLAW